MTRACVSVLTLFLFSVPSFAQTGSRDNCDLSVRVRTDEERAIDTQIQVEVLATQGVLATVHTSGDEPARFRVTSGKTYRLRVSGIGIEPVITAFFDINALEQNHSETVHVKRQPADGESISASAIVSVSEMKIPKKAKAEMDKGMEAYAKGDMEKATAHFERALAEYPQYARAYDMLGALAMKDSNRGKARELFSKSIQTDNTFLPAYVDLSRMDLQDQDYGASEALLAKAMSVNPSMPDVVALLATAEFANKEYEKALADVARAHALPNHQQFAEIHLMAGKVLRMQNRIEAAIAQFQLFLIEKPNSPQGESVRQTLASLRTR